MAKLSLFVLSGDFNCGWLWVVVGGGGDIMAGCGWSWVLGMKLWLVVDGLGWWHQNYGRSWVVVDSRGWSHDLVMPLTNHLVKFLQDRIKP